MLTVADKHAVTLDLRASCWCPAREVDAPNGFAPLPGQERAAIPKLRRAPTANITQRRG